MKNILNVNKISLKPIFMSLAILFAVGVSFPNSFEKFVRAENPSSQKPKPDEIIEEEEEDLSDVVSPNGGNNNDNEVDDYPFDVEEVPEDDNTAKDSQVNGGNNKNDEVKDPKEEKETEDPIEEEEEEAADPSEEEDTNESKNYTCPSVCEIG